MKRIEVLEIVNAAMKANITIPEIEVDVSVDRGFDGEIGCDVTIWNRYEEGIPRKILDKLSSYSCIEEEGETRTVTAEDLLKLIEKYAPLIPERELIEAAKLLKEYCEHSSCYGCIFNDGSLSCMLVAEPEDFEIPKEGEADE